MKPRWRSRSLSLWLSATRIALALSVCLVPRIASAHAVGTSRGEYALNGRTATVSLLFARQELITVVPELDVDRDGLTSERELRDARRALTDAIVRHISLGTDADHCEGALDDARLVEGDGLSVRARYLCASAPSALTVTLGFLELMAHGHRHFAVSSEEHIAYVGHAQFALTATGAWTVGLSQAADLFRLGAMRVTTGYEPLLFLIALMMAGGRPRTSVSALLAAAAGHLIALVASVFGGLSPSAQLITPAMAVAVAYLALENWFVADARGRWMVTLPFGAAYGFACAAAFREIPLAPAQLPAALAAFTGGIETAQIACALLILLCLARLRRPWSLVPSS